MAAVQTKSSTADEERAAVEPFAQQLLEFARRTDPAASYTLAPPIDPGIWIMHLYVQGDLVDNLELTEALADRTTDILIEHDIGIATVVRDRGAAPQSLAGSVAAEASPS